MGDDETQDQQELTYGGKAVGLTFNPAGNEQVDRVKKAYANIIDQLNELRTPGQSERNRLISIAITEAQGVQMWAVKAITWRE